jgi:TonB family protein
MHYQLTSDWDDASILAIFRSPFLFPSVILHAFLMLFVMRGINLTTPKPDQDTPITVQLAEFRERGSPDRSIGVARGPGGPRTMPKLGTPAPAKAQSPKPESNSTETSVPSPGEEVSPPVPKPVALPGPKVLASNTRSEAINANETASDSLVQLPTKAGPTNLPTSVAPESAARQNATTGKAGADPVGIKALNEGVYVPGALRGSGSGSGIHGVPTGSKGGTGIAGGGTGSGSGGGSTTGLRGASNADFNRYLEQLEKRVKSHWKFPEDVAGVQEVAVRFSLDRAGKLLQAQVLDSSDSRLNPSAVDAMRRASPFPPIPENLAKELANEPLIVRFKVSIRVRG